MHKYIIIFIALIFSLSYKKPNQNNQCFNNTGVWVGKEINNLIFHFNKPELYKDYKFLYLKTNLLNFKYKDNFSQCKKVYAWFEDGLSLNTLTPEVKDLYFPTKIDNKYWLNIKNPKSQEYIILKFKTFCNKYKYPIHLDDHWAIPKELGNYSYELNYITKEIVKSCGTISLSVLPLNYSKYKYNLDWEYFLKNNLVSELILQNYTYKNYNLEYKKFKQVKSKYPHINFKMGIYLGEITNINYFKDLKSPDFPLVHFPLRSSIVQDILP